MMTVEMITKLALWQAIKIVGTQKLLADALQESIQKDDPEATCSQQNVARWVATGKIPPHWIPHIEAVTGVPKSQLGLSDLVARATSNRAA